MTTPDFSFHLTSSSEPYVVGLSEVILIRVLHHSRVTELSFGPGERQRYHLAAQADGRAAEEAEAHRQGDQAGAAARAHAEDLEAASVQARATPGPGPGPSIPAPAPAARRRTSTRSRRYPVPKPV